MEGYSRVCGSLARYKVCCASLVGASSILQTQKEEQMEEKVSKMMLVVIQTTLQIVNSSGQQYCYRPEK